TPPPPPRRKQTEPAHISTSSTSRAPPFHPSKAKAQSACPLWSARARCDVERGNPGTLEYSRRPCAPAMSRRSPASDTSPIHGRSGRCSDSRQWREIARKPSEKLHRHKSCALMRQRNSGVPWETCYLRWARGVVNSETLEGKSDGHEFTRTSTNEENSVLKDRSTDRWLIGA